MIPNGRLTAKFPSDFTIWKVLRQFESGAASGGHNLNITARGTAQSDNGAQSGSGQLYYESPVLNIMGRELSSLEDFQKTLSQCGINSGSVLIRVSFRATGKTLYEAMQDTSQYLSVVEPEGGKEDTAAKQASDETMGEPVAVAGPDSASNAASQTTGPTPQTEQNTGHPEPIPAPQPVEQDRSTAGEAASAGHHNTATDSSASPANADADADVLQPVSVFSAPTGNTIAAALIDEPDSDFAPTVAHAQLHQARLLAGTQNKRLKSDKELEAAAAAEAARLAAVKSVAVRVRFPDGTSAQWRFGPDATGATLFRAVRGVMAEPAQPFKLVLPHGTGAGAGVGVVRDAGQAGDTLVRGHGLRGGVLVSLVWGEGASAGARERPFLRDAVASLARDVVVPEVPRGEEDDDDDAGGSAKRAAAGRNQKGEGSGEGIGKKLPKWLKLPGKK